MRTQPLISLLLVALPLFLLAPPSQASVEASSEAVAGVVVQEDVAAQLAALVGDRAYSTSVSVDAPEEPPEDLEERADRVMGKINGYVASVFFYDVGGADHEIDATQYLDNKGSLSTLVDQLVAEAEAEGISLHRGTITLNLPEETATGEDRKASLKAAASGMPLAVLWLVLGAIYFTVRMGLVQLKAFGHAIQVTRGKYDNPDDEGEVSHFQALTAALSATVGLGNIAGVAIAISVGGPGATVWMIAAGFLGMASKFTECTLGQMYRQTRPDGSVMGGAMYYLSNGLKEMGLGTLGKFLAVSFAILCVGGSFGGGNSFQVNQSLRAISESFGFFQSVDPVTGASAVANGWVYGLVMAVLVGVVILGGIKRIAQTAEKIVPMMCGIYVAAALFVILSNVSEVPAALGTIFNSALTPAAGFGGLIGVLVQGFKRAAFSNEAGVGSAAIAHSAAKTEYPVREGIVALLEPFIDTIVVCTMTALVIVISGAYQAEVDGQATAFAPYLADNNGAGLTSQAFRQSISWFPYVLSVAVVLFAFSTMISWSYYGERCWVWLFGDSSSLVYKFLFLVFTFLGSIVTATNILDFGDLMILGMAIPNVLGVVLLSGKVKAALSDYTGKLNSGEFKTYK